jgi:RimJ/RimL family protein N-acetyltransferase
MIYGEKVQLRPVEREDLPRFVAWFSDPEVRRHLQAYLPFSLSQEERWFEAVQERVQSGDEVLLAIETEGGVHIGNVDLRAINWKDRHAELGIVIGEKSYWGHGYGTDTVRTMLRLAFEEMNLHRVFLRVDADNERGIRCYERVGFQREGTLRHAAFREGAYVDQHVMGILVHEFTSDS